MHDLLGRDFLEHSAQILSNSNRQYKECTLLSLPHCMYQEGRAEPKAMDRAA